MGESPAGDFGAGEVRSIRRERICTSGRQCPDVLRSENDRRDPERHRSGAADSSGEFPSGSLELPCLRGTAAGESVRSDRPGLLSALPVRIAERRQDTQKSRCGSEVPARHFPKQYNAVWVRT